MLNHKELDGTAAQGNVGEPVEFKPHFHEWATVSPGMICLARKKRTAVFRQYVAAETAVPVIACAAGLGMAKEKNYFFAGVARSKSIRTIDDGIGPTTDEFFTLSIGGMATVLNTSGTPIHPGDLVEYVTSLSARVPTCACAQRTNSRTPPTHSLCRWCFYSDAGTHSVKRQKTGPRRVGITVASVSSPKVIGRFGASHPRALPACPSLASRSMHDLAFVCAGPFPSPRMANRSIFCSNSENATG